VAVAFAGGVHLSPWFAAPTGEQVVVAALDLPVGHQVQDGDLTVTTWPTGTRPSGLLPHPQGRVLAGPLRRGEPLTDVRMVDGDLLRGLPPGLRAVPVRLSEAPAGLVRPGRRLDVLAGAPEGALGPDDSAPAGLVVEDALVLAIPAQATADPDPLTGAAPNGEAAAVAVLAVDGAGARRLAAVAGRVLTVALRP
jgi:Flp pilus assembly protein CpaB